MSAWRKPILRKAFLAIIFALVAGLTLGHPASALSDYYWEYFHKNGIYYYNPEGVDQNCSSTTTTGSNVTIIGDSITEGSKSEIQKLIPSATIYSKVSKTFGNASDSPVAPSAEGNPSGLSILKYLVGQGGIRQILVFALGTNNLGPFVAQSAIDEVLTLVGSNVHVYFVTNYNSGDAHKYDPNNNLFESAAQLSNVSLIDWAGEASKDATKYVAGDHIHPTPEGTKLFAQLISTAVGGQGSETGGGNSSVNGSYVNYKGDKVFTEAQIQMIEENVPIYNQAIQNKNAAQYGITWQLLAVIHSKETGLRRYNPNNGQGIWQMYSYTNGGTNANRFPPAASVSEAEFLRQTELALEHAIIPAAQRYDLSTDRGVKQLFLSYNGTGNPYYKQKAVALGFSEEEVWEGSPYVMNRYDARRDPSAGLPVTDPWFGRWCKDGVYCTNTNPNSGEYGYSFVFGAFTEYAALGGASINACLGGAVSGGLDYDKALALATDYVNNVNCSDWNAYCTHSSSGGAKANCVTFVQYFIDRFTSVHDLGSIGNGGWVVSNLTGEDVATPKGTYSHTYDYSAKGFVYGSTEPRPYSVFSTYKGSTDCGAVKCGHTGIVVGVDTLNNKIYIVQAGYNTSLSWTTSRNGIEYDLDKFTNGDYWFAYLEGIMNYDAVAEVTGG